MAVNLKSRLEASPALHVACCVAGIMVNFLLYGVLQERIMTLPFGQAQEHFPSSLFLVLCNRVVAISVAFVFLKVYREEMKPIAPWYSYFGVSASNTAATICQYEALRYVSFPVQTLGKCAKMIPVMILGTVWLRRSYKRRDYAQAAVITLGTFIFLTSGDVSSRHAKRNNSSTLWGALLMVGYLGFDGFTSTSQDKLFTGYQMSVLQQMLHTQTYSAALTLSGLLWQNQLWPSLTFQIAHPDALALAIIFSLCATLGQLCIVHTIRSFGALLFATVMTTRQFVSILLSCIVFWHPLSLLQWLGTCMVFGALAHKIRGSHKGGSHAKHASAERSETAPAPPKSPAADVPSEGVDVEKQALLDSSPRSKAVAH